MLDARQSLRELVHQIMLENGPPALVEELKGVRQETQAQQYDAWWQREPTPKTRARIVAIESFRVAKGFEPTRLPWERTHAESN